MWSRQACPARARSSLSTQQALELRLRHDSGRSGEHPTVKGKATIGAPRHPPPSSNQGTSGWKHGLDRCSSPGGIPSKTAARRNVKQRAAQNPGFDPGSAPPLRPWRPNLVVGVLIGKTMSLRRHAHRAGGSRPSGASASGGRGHEKLAVHHGGITGSLGQPSGPGPRLRGRHDGG